MQTNRNQISYTWCWVISERSTVMAGCGLKYFDTAKYFVTWLWRPKLFLSPSSQGETYFAPPLWPTISTCPRYHCWQWSTIMAEGGVKYFDTANCVKKNCNLTLNAKNVPGHLLTRRNIFCTPFMAHYFILPQLSLLIDPLVIQRILYWDECLTL